VERQHGYRSYVIKAQVSEALLEIGKVKTDLSVFYSLNGRFPVNATTQDNPCRCLSRLIRRQQTLVPSALKQSPGPSKPRR
jgi:hypothetical protein